MNNIYCIITSTGTVRYWWINDLYKATRGQDEGLFHSYSIGCASDESANHAELWTHLHLHYIYSLWLHLALSKLSHSLDIDIHSFTYLSFGTDPEIHLTRRDDIEQDCCPHVKTRVFRRSRYRRLYIALVRVFVRLTGSVLKLGARCIYNGRYHAWSCIVIID